MQLARVVGHATATLCHPSLSGKAMLLCQPLGNEDAPIGSPFVAIDIFGSALHQKVIVSTDGLGAQHLIDDDSSPIRMFIQGLVDEPALPAT